MHPASRSDLPARKDPGRATHRRAPQHHTARNRERAKRDVPHLPMTIRRSIVESESRYTIRNSSVVSVSPVRPCRLLTALCRLLFTVPAGHPSTAAVSSIDRPRMSRSVTTSRCRPGRRRIDLCSVWSRSALSAQAPSSSGPATSVTENGAGATPCRLRVSRQTRTENPAVQVHHDTPGRLRRLRCHARVSDSCAASLASASFPSSARQRRYTRTESSAKQGRSGSSRLVKSRSSHL